MYVCMYICIYVSKNVRVCHCRASHLTLMSLKFQFIDILKSLPENMYTLNDNHRYMQNNSSNKNADVKTFYAYQLQ